MSITRKGDQILFKFQLIGDSKVGKTSIMYQLCGQVKPANMNIGVDFRQFDQTFDGLNFKIQIWDLNYNLLRRQRNLNLFRGVHAMLLVIDITGTFIFYKKNKKIRIQLNKFMTSTNSFRLDKFNSEQGPVVILANKCDLEEFRQNLIIIFLGDTSDWHGIQYFEVSAKDYRTLNYMVDIVLQRCVLKYLNDKNVQEPSLSQYYQKQNIILKNNIIECQFKFKMYLLLNIYFIITMIPILYLCTQNQNELMPKIMDNIYNPSITQILFGIILLLIILVMTQLLM
ncbi:hypothetical protein pb186bvf_001678 [Paramecium bursaria]